MAARIRTPLVAAAACAAAFVVVLAIAYGVPLAERADSTALNGLMALAGGRVTMLAHAFVHSADPLPLGLMVAVVAGLGFAAGRRRQAVAALGLVGAATLTTETLKVVLAHERFDPALGAHQVGAAAYPSGHATAAMALALAAVLVASPRIRPFAVAGASLYAIAVSTGLLVLGWHFPSDLLGGMLVASFSFCLAVAAVRAAAGRPIARGASGPRLAVVSWRRVLIFGAVVVGAFAVLRAGEVASYASAHTTATVIAVAIAACAAGLVSAAGALAERCSESERPVP